MNQDNSIKQNSFLILQTIGFIQNLLSAQDEQVLCVLAQPTISPGSSQDFHCSGVTRGTMRNFLHFLLSCFDTNIEGKYQILHTKKSLHLNINISLTISCSQEIIRDTGKENMI